MPRDPKQESAPQRQVREAAQITSGAATDVIAVSAHGTSATMPKIISAELRVLDRIDGGAAS